MMEDVAARWAEVFGECQPIGYVCREALPARWLRIHSLPKSKRYPDTEPEYQELLRRHNEAATTLLGAGEPCILFAATYDDDGNVDIAAEHVVWEPGRFDALIRAVADEEAGPFLFASFDRRTAYAPYDGGADLFFASQDAVATMKAVWRDWLSARPDGV